MNLRPTKYLWILLALLFLSTILAVPIGGFLAGFFQPVPPDGVPLGVKLAWRGALGLFGAIFSFNLLSGDIAGIAPPHALAFVLSAWLIMVTVSVSGTYLTYRQQMNADD
jgi:hypothetical protein